MVLLTGNGVEMWKNIGGNKKYDRMCQWITRFWLVDREFELEMYYGRVMRHSL
jgi:hypothetical protein